MVCDVAHQESGIISPNNRLTSVVSPDGYSKDNAMLSANGVSTNSTLIEASTQSKSLYFTPPHTGLMKAHSLSHWYVLRTTYGREKKAYDYMVAKGVKAFYPTVSVVKVVHGKPRLVVQSRLPNIFFAYGSEEELQEFVYDNVNLPFLRFYYRYFRDNHRLHKTPMIVPNRQMEALQIICAAEETDKVFLSTDKINKFAKGQLVKVIKGEFAGVVGRVSRFKGQQRVGIYIDGLLTMATAYVPNSYLQAIEEGGSESVF